MLERTLNQRDLNLAEARERRLKSDIIYLARLLEMCANDPDACPDPELIPLLEPFRLLRGDLEDVEQFLSVVRDDSDPRQEDYAFVLDIMEAYTVQSALLGLRDLGELTSPEVEDSLDLSND